MLHATPGAREDAGRAIRGVLFAMFFLSGFSSLVYQVVWTRLAFASFGVITPVLSVVLSVFMLGLGLGSWIAGRFVGAWTARTRASPLVLYAAAELLIGVSAFAVPALFTTGQAILLGAGQTDSASYLALSAVVLGLSLLPWCICMGATFPLMMAFVRRWDRQFSGSFSYLYLANVLGAMTGTAATAVCLIEVFGFRGALAVAAAGNLLAALFAVRLAKQDTQTKPVDTADAVTPPSEVRPAAGFAGLSAASVRGLLFMTGFCSMAMEVVWSRSFTPVLKTQVYSFASVVFVYLGATFLGSILYRRDLRRGRRRSPATLISLLATAAFLPVLVNDVRLVEASIGPAIHLPSALLLLASIVPFCGILGYLTPQLVDEYAGGDPHIAGKAYAINIVGCIAGPLAASYLLLPWLSEKWSLAVLGAPFLAFLLAQRNAQRPAASWAAAAVAAATMGCALFVSRDLEAMLRQQLPGLEKRTDSSATVIACGQGMNKVLLVNGIGMTRLTPVTKFMVHLPLALSPRKPESALIICFGMGTTHRSALSWDIDTTAVELVPSVVAAFPYYHADAAERLQEKNSQIVIDDGRRYLQRVHRQYDVIMIDPPPPLEAAGTSLLYSREFLELARQRLRPGGIMQVWYPSGGDVPTWQATVRSVREVFPHVRAFVSIEGWGVHLLASTQPVEVPDAATLSSRLSARARRDLLEWTPDVDPIAFLQSGLSKEVPLDLHMHPDETVRITDDRPFNEYFLLRRYVLGERN